MRGEMNFRNEGFHSEMFEMIFLEKFHNEWCFVIVMSLWNAVVLYDTRYTLFYAAPRNRPADHPLAPSTTK